MSTNRYDITINKNNNIRTSAKLLYISSAKYGGTVRPTPTTAVSCFLLPMELASFLLKINCILLELMIL